MEKLKRMASAIEAYGMDDPAIGDDCQCYRVQDVDPILEEVRNLNAHHREALMKTDKEIEEQAIEEAMKVWKGQVVLPYVLCSECPPDHIKQRCVCNIMEGTAICARHWIERRVMELKAAETTVKEPFPVAELNGVGLTPLDVDDFVRL